MENDKTLFVDVYEENANQPLPIRQPLGSGQSDILVTDGDGTKYLANDGQYKGAPAMQVMPYVRGHIADRSLAANTLTFCTPDANSLVGQTNMVSGDNFVAPEDGLYALDITHGQFPTSSTESQAGICNMDGVAIATNFHRSVSFVPSVSIVTYLAEGEYLRFRIKSANAQTAIRGSAAAMTFVFRKVG